MDRKTKLLLTISRHPQCHALLEPAELAAVPVDSVHHTVLLSRTLVVGHTGLRPSEEALAILHFKTSERMIRM